ncbi:MAG TPA: TonB-dependent receptor [Pyrinomonadaceae bacterium]|nr:TonB-dependent receptor [Pyrinomonadaceae bacterium]
MRLQTLCVAPRWFTRAIAALSLVMALSIVGVAQTETGQISGKVLDPNGAAVAGASVTAKSVESGAERTVATDSEGNYTITNLQPGLYDVTATGTGFQPGTQRAQVTVGGRVSVDVPLGIQAVGGDITVVAGEAGVEVNTQTQELADVVSGTQLRELPTLTRNPYALVGISGNVSEGDTANDAATLRGAGFNINGQRTASTNILLDGGENVDNFQADIGQSIPLDAVGEFRVITSNFSAEYGRASGGIVNVSTRPGTNEFHGSVYAFNRVSRLAANDFNNNAFDLAKPVYTRNQFGYAFGGPIQKNKLFFFNSTEWTRVRSASEVVRLVPAAELLAASDPRTQAIFAGQTLTAAPTGRVFTVNDVVSGLGIGAGAFSSLPGDLPALVEVRQSLPLNVGAGFPQNTYQTTTRIDWNPTSDTQIYGRYAIEKQAFFVGSNANSPYAGFNTGVDNFNQNALLNITHTFTSNLVSQTKLVYNRLNSLQPLGEAAVQPTFYFRTNVVARLNGVNIALPGYLPFNPGSALPFGGPQNVGQVYEDMSWTKGSHTLRFGGTYVYIQDNRTFGAYQNAVAAFGTTNYTTGFNNFVAGNLRQFQVAVDPQGNFLPGSTVTLPVSSPSFSRSNRYNETALYFNDTYRVRPTVTLNLGLRYEYYGVQHNKDPELDANFYFGEGDNIFDQIANGSVFRAEESPVGALWRRDLNNFAPRIGIAWDVTGDGKTSVRGGYGLAYERNFGNITFNVIQNVPNYAVVTVQPGDPGFPTVPAPPPTNNFGPLGGGGGTAALPGLLNVRHVNENIRNAYAHFWSAAFEREIAPRTVASVEYSGSKGVSLYDLTNPNRAGSATVFRGAPPPCLNVALGLVSGPCDTANPQAVLNTRYFPLNTRGNLGRSNYHALIASLESSNFADLGLQFTARYTFSQAKDNLSSTFSEGQNALNLGFLDPLNPDLDYGFADFDVRHRFVGSVNWDSGQTFGLNSHENSLVRNVLGGWTLTGIANVRSGTPFSVFDCTLGVFFCPRLIPINPISFNASSSQGGGDDPNEFLLVNLNNQIAGAGAYFNPLTGDADFGPYPSNMTARNAFRGPGFWNVDLGVHKNIRFGERYNLQLRGEFFNVFNHANLFVDGAAVELNNCAVADASGNCTTFGVPGFKTGSRNVQLAVKFIF